MAEEKSIFSKYMLPAIFLFALLIVGIYAFAWLQSDAGARQLEKIKGTWDKYNPVTLLTSQYDEAKRAVTWTSEANATAQKQGILLKGFTALTKKAAPGTEMLFKYNIDANIPSSYSVPTDFYCRIQLTETEGEIVPPNPVRITSSKVPSVRCKFAETQTDRLAGPVRVEGGITFPYTTKDVKLPVYFARTEAAENFFEKYGINERQPIKAKYYEEAVELALGVSDENVQPVTVEEDSFPMVGIAAHNRWGGKVKSITSFELTLPEGVTIDKELSKSPSAICPFELSKTDKGKNMYRAPESVLEGISFLQISETFECWLKIDPEVIPTDADYAKKEYATTMSYIYETTPQFDVVTFE